MRKLKKIYFIFLSLFVLFPIKWVLAETEVTWPNTPFGTSIDSSSQIHHFFQYAYEWGIGIGGLLVFGMLIFAGVQYMISVGDPGKMKEAISKITSALLGLALLLSAFLILETINPQLTEIRDIESVLEDFSLRIDGIDPGHLDEPPCEFIGIYTKEHTNEDGFSDLIKYLIVDHEYRIKDDTDVTSLGSITGFRRLNDGEVKDLLDNDGNIINAPEDGRIILEEALVEEYRGTGTRVQQTLEGPFIQGGSCLITPSEDVSTWFGFSTDKCANDLGTIDITSRGVRNTQELQRAMYPDSSHDRIDCIYIENLGEGQPASSLSYRPPLWECTSPCLLEGYSPAPDFFCDLNTKNKNTIYTDFCFPNSLPDDMVCCFAGDFLRDDADDDPLEGAECVLESASSSVKRSNARDICSLEGGMYQTVGCGTLPDNYHGDSQCCGKILDDGSPEYWWVEPNICQ